jgi:hypothetical protein
MPTPANSDPSSPKEACHEDAPPRRQFVTYAGAATATLALPATAGAAAPAAGGTDYPGITGVDLDCLIWDGGAFVDSIP